MTGASEPVLIFHADGRALAVSAAAVAEIVPMPQLTRVPHAPASLLGLANVRGRVLPVVSLGAGKSGRLVVLESCGIGLAVDTVDAIRDEVGDARPLDVDRLLSEALKVQDRGRRPSLPINGASNDGAAAEATIPFLQFELSNQHYALPLEQVREVAPVPADLRSLPKTDAAMLGVASLRGRLLPVVSPAALLGLPPTTQGRGGKIVVAHVGQAEVGLRVDRVLGVLHVPLDRIDSVPPLLNRGAGEARIDSVVRAPDGIVSVLAAERIFSDETVAALIGENAKAGSSGETQTGIGVVMERFIIFRLADERYGLPAWAVEEVIRAPDDVSRLPGAPSFISGVMNHRGAVVPLIDQASRFAVERDEGDRRRRVIVTRCDEVKLALVVDDVDQIIDLPESALRPAPDVSGGDGSVFDRTADLGRDGRLTLLIDPKRLLDLAERDLLKALTAKTGAA